MATFNLILPTRISQICLSGLGQGRKTQLVGRNQRRGFHHANAVGDNGGIVFSGSALHNDCFGPKAAVQIRMHHSPTAPHRGSRRSHKNFSLH